jgi:hypothetical protein
MTADITLALMLRRNEWQEYLNQTHEEIERAKRRARAIRELIELLMLYNMRWQSQRTVFFQGALLCKILWPALGGFPMITRRRLLLSSAILPFLPLALNAANGARPLLKPAALIISEWHRAEDRAIKASAGKLTPLYVIGLGVLVIADKPAVLDAFLVDREAIPVVSLEQVRDWEIYAGPAAITRALPRMPFEAVACCLPKGTGVAQGRRSAINQRPWNQLIITHPSRIIPAGE